jgi:hypothetical protein
MKPCPTCQKSLSDNATTCPSCGHKFGIEALTIIKRSLPIAAILLVILYFLWTAQYQATVSRVDERIQKIRDKAGLDNPIPTYQTR